MEVLGVAHRLPPSKDGLDMALQATPDELEFLEQEMPRMLAGRPGPSGSIGSLARTLRDPGPPPV